MSTEPKPDAVTELMLHGRLARVSAKTQLLEELLLLAVGVVATFAVGFFLGSCLAIAINL